VLLAMLKGILKRVGKQKDTKVIPKVGSPPHQWIQMEILPQQGKAGFPIEAMFKKRGSKIMQIISMETSKLIPYVNNPRNNTKAVEQLTKWHIALLLSPIYLRELAKYLL